ncbi:hypothetical protein GOP47_0013104 [Adiantum capillus-veneris]|uniref:Heme O synthase n=1 Tax=Adiantum capillus-veneris TaxID=13818 RepID=A0A9D4ZEZ4_ADICA|nr:hypothetical protein GOP47_0013104 [Adiantum capillus-veneris]
MRMQSVKRSRFLHRCAYGASYRGCIEPKLPHEASLPSPCRDFKHVIGRTHFTIISGRHISNAKFQDSFSLNPHLQALRSLSGVAVAANAEQVTEDSPQASPLPATSTDHFATSLRHYARCYWELSKARLSMLVVTTAGAGYVMGSGLAIDMSGLSCTCLGTFLVAAAANTINQVLEVENDGQMKRTKRRPLPSKRITTENAMAWAAATSIGGVALLANQANMVAAGLGAINLVLYTLVYTPLKQIHPINTWVGAVVGAVPPLLGWAAAAGEVSIGGWILASALYFWQIPHFMAIAYLCRQDYAAGGFRMLSMQDDSGQRTALASLRNCIYLAPLGYLAYKHGLTTQWFGVETALLSAGMGVMAASFYRKPSTEGAKKLFRTSLLYLPFLLTAMIAHRLPNEDTKEVFNENRTRDVLDADIAFEERGEDQAKQFSQPPVAYFSVAPFPFLPVPDFRSS